MHVKNQDWKGGTGCSRGNKFDNPGCTASEFRSTILSCTWCPLPPYQVAMRIVAPTTCTSSRVPPLYNKWGPMRRHFAQSPIKPKAGPACSLLPYAAYFMDLALITEYFLCAFCSVKSATTTGNNSKLLIIKKVNMTRSTFPVFIYCCTLWKWFCLLHWQRFC